MPSCPSVDLILQSKGQTAPKSGPFKNGGIHEVAPKTTMQRRTRQTRNCRLQGIEAIVERQQHMPAEGDDDRFVFHRQNGRFRRLRSSALVANGRTSFPFSDRLLIDAVSLCEGPQALLTMLYRSRRTASVVRALPWRTWPIAHASNRWSRLHHQTMGSNI